MGFLVNKRYVMIVFFVSLFSGSVFADCVAHWTFDNSDGLVDKCGSYHLTNYGASSGATGVFGQAYDFEAGGTNYMLFGDLDLPSSFSICAWIKAETLNTGMRISDKKVSGNNDYYTNWFFSKTSANGVYFGFGGGASGSWFYAQTQNAVITTTTSWYHVCGVFDDTANTLRIYVNNTREPVIVYGSSSLTPYQNNGDGRIGQNNGRDWWDGLIDEVWIFNHALSPQEIENLYLYNNLRGASPSSPTKLDALIGNAFGNIFGGGLVMGAALFIFIAYVCFRSGMQTSGLVFMGLLSLGVLTVLGYVDFVIYGIVLVVAAFFFWKATTTISG